MNQPIFITGVERSGSTLIARILDICGVFKGTVSTMHENLGIKLLTDSILTGIAGQPLMPDPQQLSIPADWHRRVQSIIEKQGYKDGAWFCKGPWLSQTWPVWNYAYPNARWVIVRRRTGDIIQSCVKTGFMKTFKNADNLALIGATTEEEGWKWWVHQYEKRFVEMVEAGVNCKVIWPERMVRGDYQQIYETLEWLGLSWSSRIVETIDPMLIKSRRKEK
jgi:hypothetical protein